MKTCLGCNKYLNWDHFFFNATMKDGWTNYCRKCLYKKAKEKRKQKASEPKPRKIYQRFFYGRKIPLPPDPKHAIHIDKGDIKIVFE